MQMKVIDLLNKIANDEELPNKIVYQDKIYYMVGNNDYENFQYQEEPTLMYAMGNTHNINDEIEIIDEEKGIPERLNVSKDEEGRIDDVFMSRTELAMRVKINEIIDYLKSKESDK